MKFYEFVVQIKIITAARNHYLALRFVTITNEPQKQGLWDLARKYVFNIRTNFIWRLYV